MFRYPMRKLALATALIVSSLVCASSAWADAGIPVKVTQRALIEGHANVLITFANSSFSVPKHSSEVQERAKAVAAKTDELTKLAGISRHAVLNRFEVFPLALLRVTPGQLRKLAESDAVALISESTYAGGYRDATTTEGETTSESSGRIGALDAHARGNTGASTTIAVIDGGIDDHHPALAGRVVDGACFSASMQTCPTASSQFGAPSATGIAAGRPSCDPSAPTVCDTHGTHVAGIAAGNSPGHMGVAPGANLISARIIEARDGLQWADLISALDFVASRVASRNVVAINMSLGGMWDGFPEDLDYCDNSTNWGSQVNLGEIHTIMSQFASLRAGNVAPVTTSGNGFWAQAPAYITEHYIGFPGCVSSAVTIGNSDKYDQIYTEDSNSGSGRSRAVSLMAPGTAIESSVPGGGWGAKTGTSMAAPHVAGAWALQRERFPYKTVDELVQQFRATGEPIIEPNFGHRLPRLDLHEERLGRTSPCGEHFTQEGPLTTPWYFHFGCNAITETVLSRSRIAVKTSCGAVYTKAGRLDTQWQLHFGCGTAQQLAITEGRIGVLTSCGSLEVKEGSLNNLWQTVRPCNSVRAFAMAGSRIAIIDKCGQVLTQEGSLASNWQLHFGCGWGRSLALTVDRFAAMSECGSVQVKNGSLSGLWIPVLDCGAAKAFAMSGDRMAYIDTCGAVRTKEEPSTTWQFHFGCSIEAKGISVSMSRIAVVTGCGGLQMKEGSLNSLWQAVGDCGSTASIALSCYDGNCNGTPSGPQTTITSGPSDGSTVTVPAPGFTFTSDIANSTFECSVNGGGWYSCGAIHAPAFENGSNYFQVRARDSFGVDDTPAIRTFNVNAPAPRIGRFDGCGAYHTQEGPLTTPWYFHFGCDWGGETALSTSRLAVSANCGAVYTKEGRLDSGWQFHFGCGTAKALEMTESRFGVLTQCGGIQLKEGSLLSQWLTVSPCGTARAFALGADRMAIIDPCGAVYTKQGAWNAPWELHFGCGTGRDITVKDGRIAVLTTCGGVQMKEGALNTLWREVLPCGSTKAFAMSGTRLGYIDACGAVYSKEGPLDQPWINQMGCNSGKALAVTSNRFGVLTQCGGLEVKQGQLNTQWQAVTGCGQTTAVGFGCDDGNCGATIPVANTTITAGPAEGSTVTGASTTVEFNSEIQNVSFECSLNGSAYTSCSSPYTASLDDGPQSFSVRATDFFGTDATPATRSFVADAPLTLSVSSPSNGETVGRDLTVVFAKTGATSVSCRVDSGTIIDPCVSPRAFTGLASGNHTLTVTARDALSNGSLTVVRNFTTDATGPESTITSGPAAQTSDPTPDFSFTADDPGATFECRNAPVDASFGPCSGNGSHAIPTALADGTYTFSVRATDRFANQEPVAAVLTYTVDTVPPTVNVSSPAENQVISGQAVTITFSTSGATSVSCRLDTGSVQSACTSPTTYAAVPYGSHSITVVATDAAGNSTTVVRSFSNSVPPMLTASSTTIPASPAVQLATGTTDWVHWGYPTTPTLVAERKAGVNGISDATMPWGGTLGRSTAPGASYAWSGGTNPTSTTGTATAIYTGGDVNRGFRLTVPASNGLIRTLKLYVGAWKTTGRLNVRASDGSVSMSQDASLVSASNAKAPSTRVYTISYRSAADTTLIVEWQQHVTGTAGQVFLHAASIAPDLEPDTSITAPTEDAVVSTATPTISYSSSESGSAYMCKIDNGAFATCGSSFTPPALAEGRHTVSVKAIDASGQEDPTPAVRNFWVSLPVARVIGPTVDTLSTGPYNLTATATNPPAVDWAHWGLTASLTQAGMSGATQLGAATGVGSPTVTQLSSGMPSFNWTGGDNSGGGKSTGTATAISTSGAGKGFSLTAQGDPSRSKKLTLWLGVTGGAVGRLELAWGTGSAFATSTPLSGTANGVITINYRPVAATPLTVKWTATTATGAVNLQSARLTDDPDIVAPTTTISSGPANNSTVPASPAPQFSFTANETGVSFECRLDAAAFAACSSPLVLPGLANGSHAVYVRAIDRAGNVEQRPPLRMFNIG